MFTHGSHAQLHGGDDQRLEGGNRVCPRGHLWEQQSVQKTSDGVCLVSSGIFKVRRLPFQSVILTFLIGNFKFPFGIRYF